MALIARKFSQVYFFECCVLILLIGANLLYGQVRPAYIDEAFYTGLGSGSDFQEAFTDTMTVQPDGKILVSGFFTRGVNGTGRRRSLARFDSQGKLDLSFRDLSNPSTTYGYFDVYLRPDGKIYAAGYFNNYSGVSNPNIVLLNADGTLNTSFTSPFSAANRVHAIGIQSDGKIIAAGFFSDLGPDVSVVRLMSNGTVDASFSPFGITGAVASSLVVQPDGKIVLAMNVIGVVGDHSEVVRLNSNGTRDNTFDSGIGGNDIISAIRRQSDGKYIVAGGFTQYNGVTRNSITRLNSDGTTDSSFNIGTGANLQISDLLLQPDGKVLICGRFSVFDGFARYRIARLNSNGSVDTSFNTDAGSSHIPSIDRIALQGDGKIWVGGDINLYTGKVFLGITRINSDGSVDGSLINNQGFRNVPINGSTVGTVASLDVQPDGRIIVGGRFVSYNGTSIGSNIARINPDGMLDATFVAGTGANDHVNTVALQTDGRIIFAGSFTQYNGTVANRIARINANGSLDTSFTVGSGPDGEVISIALQTDGKILIAGAFSTVNGISRSRIARLNANGSVDTTFIPGSGADGTVLKVVLQPDGQILIGGDFDNYNGVNRGEIARLNPNGTLDSAFGSPTGVDNFIRAVNLQSDGKILIGGAFTNYGGTSRVNLARLHANGTLDTSFEAPGASAFTVFGIAIQSDAKIIAVGFNQCGGCRDIDRFNPDGSHDTTFPLRALAYDGYYMVVKVQADRKILLGGFFDNYDPHDPELYAEEQIQRGSIIRLFSGLERRPKFDFDGDGSDDIGVFYNGLWSIHQSGSLDKNASFGLSNDKIVPGDYDGDGKTDLAVFRSSEGNWYINKSSDSSTYAVNFGLNGDVPQPGDYDGDRKTDIAVWRPSTQYWYILNSSTGQVAYIPFGLSTDKPVAEDYDGDGKSDVAIFRDGTWWILQSSNGFATSYQWGISTDILTYADYDGDGKCDFGVYRDGSWYLSKSREGISSFQLGITGDKPTPADFDGDGKTDLAVFRGGDWIIAYSNSSLTSTSFGNPIGLPIPSAFIPN